MRWNSPGLDWAASTMRRGTCRVSDGRSLRGTDIGGVVANDDVAFFGNIYLAASNKISHAGDPIVARLRERVHALRAGDPNLSPYHAYVHAIRMLEANERDALKLVPDQLFYWHFLYDELYRY